MKVIGINGSPKKNGNTSIMIKEVFRELEKNNIETEMIQLGGQPAHGCIGCMKCYELKNGKCVIDNDVINNIIGKMVEADGIILGSPVYTADITSEMSALIARGALISHANGGGLLRHKVTAAVTAVRRGGAIHAFDTMNHFLHITEGIMVGASYWNMAYGLMPGDVQKDEEGMQNMKNLGENMAWLLNKINK